MFVCEKTSIAWRRLSKNGVHCRENQGTKYIVDLRRRQPAAAVHPPDQHREESRVEIVNEQIEWHVRIRCFQLRYFSLALSAYQFFHNLLQLLSDHRPRPRIQESEVNFAVSISVFKHGPAEGDHALMAFCGLFLLLQRCFQSYTKVVNARDKQFILALEMRIEG